LNNRADYLYCFEGGSAKLTLQICKSAALVCFLRFEFIQINRLRHSDALLRLKFDVISAFRRFCLAVATGKGN